MPYAGTEKHHGARGYSRYLSPPPFELVGNETVSKFVNTTAAPLSPQADSPLPEQANYYDVGVQQKITRSVYHRSG